MSQDAVNRQDKSPNAANSPTNPVNAKDVQGMEPSHETHRLSIGLVIGATMGAIGIILLLQGLFGTNANYSLSDGINVNLWWGLVLVIFGILMCGGNILSARRHTHS